MAKEVPLRDSPFKELRLQTNMTQRAMVRESGLSTTAIIYTEAALYEKVPLAARIALTDALVAARIDFRSWLDAQYGVVKLDPAMRLWQRAKRRHTGFVQGLDMVAELPLDYLIAMWPNPDRFAKDLCIPPSAVHQYRSGDVHSVPEIITTALSEAGYRHEPSTMAGWQQKHSSPPPLV